MLEVSYRGQVGIDLDALLGPEPALQCHEIRRHRVQYRLALLQSKRGRCGRGTVVAHCRRERAEQLRIERVDVDLTRDLQACRYTREARAAGVDQAVIGRVHATMQSLEP